MARRALPPAAWEVAQQVHRALADHAGPLVVAVSGGADSLALAAGTAWVARREPIQPVAVIVDHQWQQGSAQVAARAAEQCGGLGLDAVVEKVTVTGEGGPESAARRARHTVLHTYPGPILMGHTRDDQAETVLLGLLRGSGVRSLAGIAPRQGRVWHPLLDVMRVTTEQACCDWGLEWWDDPHNQCEDFSRVRVRQQIMPVLRDEMGAGVVDALARTAWLARDDADALDQWAATVDCDGPLSVVSLLKVPVAVRRRVILGWLRTRGEAGSAHVAAVESLVSAWHGQGAVSVSGGSVRRVGDVLMFAEGDGGSQGSGVTGGGAAPPRNSSGDL